MFDRKSFRDTTISSGNPNHGQNIKLGDTFLLPIHHLRHTLCPFHVLIPKFHCFSLPGPSSPASPFTLAKPAYVSYSYLDKADCIWYHFSWRYLHLVETYGLCAQCYPFSTKCWLCKSLFKVHSVFCTPWSPLTAGRVKCRKSIL